ncbi:putative ABC transporter C family member 15 isoform X2 [Oryza glaberrima]|nr:putative ABC transporter C family member 15 isoform X2 [Oryza glaberrima]
MVYKETANQSGIQFTCGTQEPFPDASKEENVKNRRKSSYGEATISQHFTFSWMNGLLAKGANKPLNEDDIPDVGKEESAQHISRIFSNIIVKGNFPLTVSSICKAAFLLIWKKAALNATFGVLSVVASFVGAYLIKDFVGYLSGDNGFERGYSLVLVFVGAKAIETLAYRQWFFGSLQVYLRLRTSLMSQVYQKVLYLSSQSRQKHTSGEIINYVSVDIERIVNVAWYVNMVFMMPIQITLATYILWKNLGLGSLAGIATTAIIMLCNIPFTRIQKRLHARIMKAKDDRMDMTSEVIRSMKILKLQAWDIQYLRKLEYLRKGEHLWLWEFLRLKALLAFMFWGAPAVISIMTFASCILMGIPLTAGRVLSTLATVNILKEPIFSLPELLTAFAQGKVSADRIVSYLQEEEIRSDAIEEVAIDENEFSAEIDQGAFSWKTDAKIPTLQDIHVKIHKGMKVAVCGAVGSGKSSLLSCVLGEMPKVQGTVKVFGTKAYVPQSSWILSGTIRENILFGSPFETDRYERTIEACALVKDIGVFSDGDMTDIGERGTTMSGGQKQRIQIARAVYKDADVYLLDDPFSAVDPQTGRHLYKKCLMGVLRDKTVLYVTHQVEFLVDADLIMVMQNGRIAQAGKFQELQQNMAFGVIFGAHFCAVKQVCNAKGTSIYLSKHHAESEKVPSINESDAEKEISSKWQNTNMINCRQEVFRDNTEEGKLLQGEERENGYISKQVYWSYLTAARGGLFIPMIIAAQCFFQIFEVGSNYWMASACHPRTGSKSKMESTQFMVYVFISVGSALCILIRAVLVAVTGLLTSEKLLKSMMHCIFHAPMSFFDSTPTGRILNRASIDQSVLDLETASTLSESTFSVMQFLGTILIISYVSWPVLIIFIPSILICIRYQRYYSLTATELARLSGIQKAPILHHFGETFYGAAIIRAFRQEDRFYRSNLSLLDNHSRPWFHLMAAVEWLSFRMNLLCNFVFGFSLVLLVRLPQGFVNPSIGGLVVMYAWNLNTQLSEATRNISRAEANMISVERILQYTKLPSEAPTITEGSKPPMAWPEFGMISISNLEVRYAEHLPSVLKNITCVIPAEKTVGIVGRTGSGKSTLVQVLFRIVEPREGTIKIDSIDICKIGLHDLRSRICILPQDPVMFDGTIRGNLDPMNEYPDSRIWEVVDKCQLGNVVRSTEKKLDEIVIENGDNWSMGQRQLFCLGRILLRKSKILVLDEATASVDSATDRIIQEIIRQEFKDCTVLAIAHRMNTVIDSDLILVLGEGSILEYDAPTKLLQREDSTFSKLTKEYSQQSQHFKSSTAMHRMGSY